MYGRFGALSRRVVLSIRGLIHIRMIRIVVRSYPPRRMFCSQTSCPPARAVPPSPAASFPSPKYSRQCCRSTSILIVHSTEAFPGFCVPLFDIVATLLVVIQLLLHRWTMTQLLGLHRATERMMVIAVPIEPACRRCHGYHFTGIPHSMIVGKVDPRSSPYHLFTVFLDLIFDRQPRLLHIPSCHPES